MVRPTFEVVSCSKEQDSNVSLHRVPKSEQAKATWIRFLHVANRDFPEWKPVKQVMRVCSQHFKLDSFKCGLSGTRNVLPGCFPSVLNGIDITKMIINDIVQQKVSTDAAISQIVTPFSLPDPHAQCNKVIEAQMQVIAKLKADVASLQADNFVLRQDLYHQKRIVNRSITQRSERQQQRLKRKNVEINELNSLVKRLKAEPILPDPPTSADSLLYEMISRRNMPMGQAYSEALRLFAFNAHYISPKGYGFLRDNLRHILPDPSSLYRWNKNVNIQPGFLELSLNEIRRMAAEKKMYFALSFDEMSIRQQIVFDGTKMIGRVDYGNLIKNPPSATLAKSALVCLATAVNGHKAIPIAYALTDGLQAQALSEVMLACVREVEKTGAKVLSISFDGLKANFSAAQLLGANLNIESEDYRPFFHDKKTRNDHYIVPDAAHMFKLVRNTWEKCRVLYNAEGKVINWGYVQRLSDVQEEEQLRAANRLTTRHVNFHQKKMNVRLCAQVLSEGLATSIDFCRKIGMLGFDGSEATTEFLRINNYTFDMLNARPFGEGSKAPLSKHDKEKWTSIIKSTKAYYMGLQISLRSKLVPIYTTKCGTFVKGIIAALTSVEIILSKMESGEIDLSFLPTYRLGQDGLEVTFGTVRRRFGANDNPNCAQFAYCIRSMLCFKLQTCKNGNCIPQENLSTNISGLKLMTVQSKVDSMLPENNAFEHFLEDTNVESFASLSLFVENVVVYIAGFIGMKLKNSLKCSDCISSLISVDIEGNQMRQDFCLLLEKDRGGLIKPSADLLIVCKIAERIIRAEQAHDMFKLNSKKIEILVRRECVGRDVFKDLHTGFCSPVLRKASMLVHADHRMVLISEICKAYCKTRLNYIAKRSSLIVKPITTRSRCNKLVHFTGC